jgi:hypothetical protein
MSRDTRLTNINLRGYMYTTLNMLKSTHACVPGYARMLAFFGTSQKVKEIPIPLAMIAMVAQVDDCQWAASNSTVFDPEEFLEFYKRNLAPALQCRFWSVRNDQGRDDKSDQHPIIKEAFQEIEKVVDYDSAVAWMNKYNLYSLSHWIWTDVLNGWLNPAQFTIFVTNNFEVSYHRSHKEALRLSERKRQSVQSEDESDQTLDDELTDSPSSHRRALARRRPAEPKKTSDPYYFKHDDAKSSGYNLASLLAPKDQDPYSTMLKFIIKHDLAGSTKTRGFMLTEAPDNSFHLSMNLSNPETIFHMFHMLNATDFDINRMLGINQQTARIQARLINEIGLSVRNASTIQHVEVDPAGALVRVSEERLASAGVTSQVRFHYVDHNQDEDEDGDEDEDEDEDD